MHNGRGWAPLTSHSTWSRLTPWVAAILLPAAAGALALSCAYGPRDADGKEKKVWSGKSYALQTTVQAAPILSAAAPGWDSERVWSGDDDWEPAVGVDPVNPGYVYQLTTRYSGATPCRNCSPNIIFRRSVDGGSTWGPTGFSTSPARPRTIHQIEVATTGHLFACFLSAYRRRVIHRRSTAGTPGRRRSPSPARSRTGLTSPGW
jgi:hypothetical protein